MQLNPINVPGMRFREWVGATLSPLNYLDGVNPCFETVFVVELPEAF
jgi:hypothetical protein